MSAANVSHAIVDGDDLCGVHSDRGRGVITIIGVKNFADFILKTIGTGGRSLSDADHACQRIKGQLWRQDGTGRERKGDAGCSGGVALNSVIPKKSQRVFIAGDAVNALGAIVGGDD